MDQSRGSYQEEGPDPRYSMPGDPRYSVTGDPRYSNVSGDPRYSNVPADTSHDSFHVNPEMTFEESHDMSRHSHHSYDDEKPPLDTSSDHEHKDEAAAGTGSPEEETTTKKSKLKGLFGRGKSKEKKKKDEDSDDEHPKEELTSKGSKKRSFKGMFKKKDKGKETQSELEEQQEGEADQSVTPDKPTSTSTPPDPYASHGVSLDQTQDSQPPPFNGSQQPIWQPSTKPPRQHEPVSFTTLMKRQPKSYAATEEKAEVKPPREKSSVRCSTFLVVLLIILFFVGILMCALSSYSEILNTLGPIFIGLSLFALIGKIFFTLFLAEEPHPILKPAGRKFNELFNIDKNQQQTGTPHDSAVVTMNPTYSSQMHDDVNVMAVPYAPHLQYYPPGQQDVKRASQPHHVMFDPSLDTIPSII